MVKTFNKIGLKKLTLITVALLMLVSMLTACGSESSASVFEVEFKTYSDESIASVEVEEGEIIAEPTASERDGYTFLGWFTDADFSVESKYDFSSAVTSNLTLHANWEEVEVLDDEDVDEDIDEDIDETESVDNEVAFTTSEFSTYYTIGVAESTDGEDDSDSSSADSTSTNSSSTDSSSTNSNSDDEVVEDNVEESAPYTITDGGVYKGSYDAHGDGSIMMDYTLDLNSSNTYTLGYETGGANVQVSSGTWSVSGNVVTLTDSSAGVYGTLTYSDNVLSGINFDSGFYGQLIDLYLTYSS